MLIKKIEKKKPKTLGNLSWSLVEKHLQEKTDSGAAMALIETEKILDQVLAKLQFKAKDTKTKVLLAKKNITNFEELKAAMEVTEKLKNELNATVTQKEARETLSAYFEAIRFLTKLKTDKGSLTKRIILFFQKRSVVFKKIFRNIVLSFFLFFLIVFALDSTLVGRKIVETTVNISHFLFSWILFTFLLLFGVITIIISTFVYFERKRERKSMIKEPVNNFSDIKDNK